MKAWNRRTIPWRVLIVWRFRLRLSCWSDHRRNVEDLVFRPQKRCGSVLEQRGSAARHLPESIHGPSLPRMRRTTCIGCTTARKCAGQSPVSVAAVGLPARSEATPGTAKGLVGCRFAPGNGVKRQESDSGGARKMTVTGLS